MVFSIVLYIISEGIQQIQFLVERFVPLSSQFKIIPVSTSEKPFQFERTGFFSNLTYGIGHLIQKIYVLPRLFKKAQI